MSKQPFTIRWYLSFSWNHRCQKPFIHCFRIGRNCVWRWFWANWILSTESRSLRIRKWQSSHMEHNRMKSNYVNKLHTKQIKIKTNKYNGKCCAKRSKRSLAPRRRCSYHLITFIGPPSQRVSCPRQPNPTQISNVTNPTFNFYSDYGTKKFISTNYSTLSQANWQ